MKSSISVISSWANTLAHCVAKPLGISIERKATPLIILVVTIIGARDELVVLGRTEAVLKVDVLHVAVSAQADRCRRVCHVVRLKLPAGLLVDLVAPAKQTCRRRKRVFWSVTSTWRTAAWGSCCRSARRRSRCKCRLARVTVSSLVGVQSVRKPNRCWRQPSGTNSLPLQPALRSNCCPHARQVMSSLARPP